MPKTVYRPKNGGGTARDGPDFAGTKLYVQYWNAHCKRRKPPQYKPTLVGVVGDDKTTATTTVIDTHYGSLDGSITVDLKTTICDMISYLEQNPLTVSMGGDSSTHICAEVLFLRLPRAPMNENVLIELSVDDIQLELDQLVKLDLIERYGRVSNFDGFYKTKKKK